VRWLSFEKTNIFEQQYPGPIEQSIYVHRSRNQKPRASRKTTELLTPWPTLPLIACNEVLDVDVKFELVVVDVFEDEVPTR
jgi:hypothetical protein